MNETLDSVFDASDDEAEQDAIVTQVLDEIGIDMTSKVGRHVVNSPHCSDTVLSFTDWC